MEIERVDTSNSLMFERFTEPPSKPPLYKQIFFPSTPKKKKKDTPLDLLYKYVPIVKWLPNYNVRSMLKGDIFAGCTIAILAIPQLMAYALIAELPKEYGLYSGIVPAIVYAIFGSSREASIGFTAVNCLIMASSLSPLADPDSQRDEYNNIVLFAGLISGLWSFFFGVFNLGRLVTYISPEVITGFTTGSAIVISITQLGGLFGIKAEKAVYSIMKIINVLKALDETKWIAAVNGFVTIIILFLMKRGKTVIPGQLVVAVLSTIVSYCIHRFTDLGDLLPVIEDIPAGLPNFHVPQVSAGMVGSVIVPGFLLMIIGFLQSFSVSQKFAERHNYSIQPSQEFLALGMSKIVGAFFLAADNQGAFSRTAVNVAAGAKSQLASIFTAVLMIVSLLFLTPALYYLPTSTLSGIVIMSVSTLYEFPSYYELFKISRSDAAVAFVTAVLTFTTNIEIGISAGIGCSLLNLLYRLARPHYAILGELQVYNPDLPQPEATGSSDSPDVTNEHIDRIYRDVTKHHDAKEFANILIFRFDSSLYFMNVEYWKSVIVDLLTERTHVPEVKSSVRAKRKWKFWTRADKWSKRKTESASRGASHVAEEKKDTVDGEQVLEVKPVSDEGVIKVPADNIEIEDDQRDHSERDVEEGVVMLKEVVAAESSTTVCTEPSAPSQEEEESKDNQPKKDIIFPIVSKATTNNLIRRPSNTSMNIPSAPPIYLILDFSTINDIDTAGSFAVMSTIQYIETKFNVEVLIANVRGTVRDSLWMTLGGIEDDVNPPQEIHNYDHAEVNGDGKEDQKEGLKNSRFFLTIGYAIDAARGYLKDFEEQQQ